MVRSAITAILVGTMAIGLVSLPSQAGEPGSVSVAAAQPQVLYLQTEFLPYTRNRVDRGIPYRLGRELVRQAVLIAARDEMGLVTCDETLKETEPLDAQIVQLMPMERADLHGKWNLKLVPYDTKQTIWEKTYDYFADGTGMYADIIPKLEADTRGAFVEALRGLGLKGKKPTLRDPELPGKEIEAMLMKVDFVAQFGAVRAAHQAIVAHGEIPEWLGVLVRGYGNLATLTAHQWNSSTEVFTARSWLYAQRMMVSCKESDLALWHHAYAAAMGGAMHYALTDLEKLEQRGKNKGESAEPAIAANATPVWARLIRPFCMCDRDTTTRVGQQDASLKPWAVYIRFLLSNYCWQARWMYEDGIKVSTVCPAAFGVYDRLAEYGKFSYVKQTGASTGPIMFARHIPNSVKQLPDLPESLRQQIAVEVPEQSVFGRLFGKRDASIERFSDLPMSLAGELRDLAEEADSTDLSWSVLAFLIEEEQFVQVVYNSIDTNGHAMSPDFDKVMPLIKDHRYAPLIDSLRYDSRKSPDEWKDALELITFEDPRRNMVLMFRVMWNLQDRKGNLYGHVGYDLAHRNFTLPGMVEYLRPTTRYLRPISKHYINMFTAELNAIAPHFDNSTLLLIRWTKDPTSEQLKQWESKLTNNPRAFRHLADSYVAAGDTESAIRCYARSLEWISTAEAAIPMSGLCFAKGDYDAWEKTLLTFLETDNQARQHGSAQMKLATGFAARGMWRKARAPAEAYAKQGYPKGLLIGSFITEGLGEWKDSEKWMRQLSEEFGYGNGYYWYFWCRRTGRGDLDAARETMQTYFERTPPSTMVGHIVMGISRYAESDPRGCLESYRKALAFQPSFTCTFMISEIARQLGDDKLRDEVLAKMEKASVELTRTANPEQAKVYAAGIAILELVKSGDASKTRLDRIEQLLFELPLGSRCPFAHYLGVELLALGKKDEAEKYWRHVLTAAPRDDWAATLSGIELAKLHGTSRPDGDVLDGSDVWQRSKVGNGNK